MLSPAINSWHFTLECLTNLVKRNLKNSKQEIVVKMKVFPVRLIIGGQFKFMAHLS